MTASDREKPQSANVLVEGRGLLMTALADGRIGAELVGALSNVYDRYFRERLAEFGLTGEEVGAPYALVAVGGYGRRELCPYSDIDVLVVFNGAVPAGATSLARFLFHPLWDLGVELGHGVRGMEEGLSLARSDFQVMASFLDLRFLAGDRRVYEVLAARLTAEVFSPFAAKLAVWLKDGSEVRKNAHGDAGAVLEPNLKEGLGGLRDWHQVRWLMRLAGEKGLDAVPFAAELDALDEDARFLLVARSHLHVLSGRKNDKLYFEFQEQAAERMGYGPKDGRMAVERFLAELLRRMEAVKALRASLWPVLAMPLGAMEDSAPPKLVAEGVELALEGLRFAPGLSEGQALEAVFPLLQQAADLKSPLAHEAAMRLKGLAGALGEAAAASLEAGCRAFAGLTAVMAADVSGLAMEAAMAAGILKALLPEFGRVEDLVAFDVYHVHPVGRHSLEAVRLLAEVKADPGHRFREYFDRLPRPELVFWGALLHDVGKGLGGGHAEKGAILAGTMLSRLGVDEKTRRAVTYLVREHLLLPETATSRDLSDRDVVARAAGRVATAERLDLLLLLARADGLATGPQAWTAWKESLVLDLYGRLKRALENELLFDANDAQVMLATRDRVRALAGGRFEPEALERALDAMPPRYLVAVPPEEVATHLDLLAELDTALEEDRRMRPGGRGGETVAVFAHRPLPDGHGFALTVAARNIRTLFPTVAGVLALHDLSILGADVSVWDDGTRLLLLTTANPPDVLYADEVFARVGRAVRYALAGKLSLDYRLAQKRGSFLAGNGKGPKTPPKVTVNNDASDLYTVIDVAADDRVGLLYDITHTLYDLRLDVHLAKAVTPMGRVRDVFFVRGVDNRKVEDPEQAAEITAALTHRLAE